MSTYDKHLAAVLDAVAAERGRQERLHGPNTAASPELPRSEAFMFLIEELGEAAKELNDAKWKAKSPAEAIAYLQRGRFELVQSAATIVAMCEAIDATTRTYAASGASP